MTQQAEPVFDHHSLRRLREHFPATQVQFSRAMGVPLRTYEDLEQGRNRIREIHRNAAFYACLKLSLARRMAPPLQLVTIVREIMEHTDNVLEWSKIRAGRGLSPAAAAHGSHQAGATTGKEATA